MFGSSTQLNSWTFKNDSELEKLRQEANENYIEKYKNERTVEECKSHFLLPSEELILVREYVFRLRQLCQKFEDPRDSRIRMPVYVTTTATHYLRRFYLYNSVMDYHPKDIMHTCIFLACKIEEFYVTISDYVHNIDGDDHFKNQVHSTILNSELQTTQELQFHLIVHQPYRPVEGLIIDLKTRYPTLTDAESLRSNVEDFLDRVHHTDAILLYSPSQLALAAVTTAASKVEQNLDSYVTDILFVSCPQRLPTLIDAVRKIKRLVKGVDHRATPSTVSDLEDKLQGCRNPVNDPNTEEYRINQARLEQDDDDFGPMVSSVAVGGSTTGGDPLMEAMESISNNNNNNTAVSTTGNDDASVVSGNNRDASQGNDDNIDNNDLQVLDDDGDTNYSSNNNMSQPQNESNDPSSYNINDSNRQNDDGVSGSSFSVDNSSSRNAVEKMSPNSLRVEQRLQRSSDVHNPGLLPEHWSSVSQEGLDDYETDVVGGVYGVGLGMRSTVGGMVMDGGVIEDDEDDDE